MSNFGYLRKKKNYQAFAEELIQAEELYGYNTKICVRQCRAALEATVRWIYQKEGMYSNEMTLGQLVHNADFIHLLDYKIWSLLPDFVTVTNEVVHIQKEADKEDALEALEVLFKFVQWIEIKYSFFYIDRSFDKDQIGVPDTEAEIGTGKLVICNRKLLAENYGQNTSNDSTSRKISLEKTLNSSLKNSAFSNQYVSEIINKNREWKEENTKEIKTVSKNKRTYTMENVEKLILLAEQGDAEARYQLGENYFKGKGVALSYEEAVKWYTKAAKQGHAWAQHNLAHCYHKGYGVKQSYEEALKWYIRAEEYGRLSSFYEIADCEKELRKLREEKEKTYKIAVEQNDLGNKYYYGHGVEQSYEEALKLYRKAAEQGVADAQYNLGQCYSLGKGVEKDYTEAIKWFKKAAELGHLEAQRKMIQYWK